MKVHADDEGANCRYRVVDADTGKTIDDVYYVDTDQNFFIRYKKVAGDFVVDEDGILEGEAVFDVPFRLIDTVREVAATT